MQNTTNIIIGIVALVALYFVAKKLNLLGGSEEENEDSGGGTYTPPTTTTTPNPKPKPSTNTGSIPEGEIKQNPKWNKVRPGFNAANEATVLAELLSYSDFAEVPEKQRKDYRAFEKILNHYHNENIEIHNAWRRKYASGNFFGGIKNSLRKQVEAEYVDPWRTDTIALKKRVLARLDYLKIQI